MPSVFLLTVKRGYRAVLRASRKAAIRKPRFKAFAPPQRGGAPSHAQPLIPKHARTHIKESRCLWLNSTPFYRHQIIRYFFYCGTDSIRRMLKQQTTRLPLA